MHPAHNSICATHPFSLHPSIQGKQVNRSREKRRCARSCKSCVSHLECNQPLEVQVTTLSDCRWKRASGSQQRNKLLRKVVSFLHLHNLTRKLLLSAKRTFMAVCKRCWQSILYLQHNVFLKEKMMFNEKIIFI